MGDRGGDHDEIPTADEIDVMGRLVAEAIGAGALGFSTSRTVHHTSADGSVTPTLTATRDELLGIAHAMGTVGSGVFEVIADFVDLDREFSLLREMVDISGRPMSITTLQRPEFPVDEYQRILALITEANHAGLPIRGQVAPRPIGFIACLDGGTNPLAGSASYQSLEGLPIERRVVELRTARGPIRILAELAAAPALPYLAWPMFALESPARYELDPTESIGARAAVLGVDPIEVIYDALVEPGGPGAIFVPFMNFGEQNLQAT